MDDSHKMLHAPENEGPEVWKSDHDGPIPVVNNNLSVYSNYHAPRQHSVQPPSTFTQNEPTRKTKWLLMIFILVASIVGIGAGVGIGFAIHQPDGNASSSPNSTTATPTASSTIPAVTTGVTGIADFSCATTLPNTYTTTTNPSNHTTFMEECFVDYVGRKPAYGDPSHNVTDLGHWTVYSFQDCMEQCANYNEVLASSTSDSTEESVYCRAVTYTTNLTWAIPKTSGNCYMKDRRGLQYHQGDQTGLFASAYISDS